MNTYNRIYAMKIPSTTNDYKVKNSFHLNWLDNIARINIFVGENNAGKSRCLREIFSNVPIEYWALEVPSELIRGSFKILFNEIGNMFSRTMIKDYDNIIMNMSEFQHFIDKKDNIESGKLMCFVEYLFVLIEKTSSEKEIGPYTMIESSQYHRFNAMEFNRTINKEAKKFVDECFKRIPQTNRSFRRIYIPTLRGLRKVSDNADTTNEYAARTANDYFKHLLQKSWEVCSIETGLSMYSKVKALLLGNLAQRKKIEKYQDFLSKAFFDGQAVTLIPNEDSQVLHIKIGIEAEKPIYLIGDGIQQIIILTFPLFENSDNELLLFIEEPELYLHPSLQRKLVEVFLKPEFEKTQVFFTTHSNHFLDLTLEMNNISIYTFCKLPLAANGNTDEIDPNFSIENISNDDTRALELLGANNSSVLLSNCTIWVEGITDRLYIRHMLKFYCQCNKLPVFQEDLHYSFVEYSGNNITHWSFLENPQIQNGFRTINVDRLCGKLMLITDKDSDMKIPRHEKLQERLGERFFCLPCREIENILHSKVITSVVEEYEDTKQVQFKKPINETAYKDKLLGKYLDSAILNSSRKARYASDSGTISDKVNFAKKAISHIHSLDDMTQDSIDMCARIYEFIKNCNK